MLAGVSMMAGNAPADPAPPSAFDAGAPSAAPTGVAASVERLSRAGRAEAAAGEHGGPRDGGVEGVHTGVVAAEGALRWPGNGAGVMGAPCRGRVGPPRKRSG